MHTYHLPYTKPSYLKKYTIAKHLPSHQTKPNIIKCPIIEPNRTLHQSAQELNEIDSSDFNKFLTQFEQKAKEAISQIKCFSPTLPQITPRDSVEISANEPNQLIQEPQVGKSQVIAKKNSLDKYKIGKEIGKGAYATVKLVTLKFSKEKYAMKIYERFRILDKSKKTALNREIQIMKKIDHINIVKLHEVIYTKKQIVVIMEYVNGKSLSDYVKEFQSKKIPEEECKKIFLQICNGIAYLHNLHISHRDIKMENILLDKENTVKIIDFGFGVFSPDDNLQEFYCGTPNYMPPEIVLKNKYIGQYADLWSLGVLLFKLLCGEFPFRAPSEKELYNVIKKGQYDTPKHLSEEAINLIKGLLLINPICRHHCDIVLLHEWFTESEVNRNEEIEKEANEKVLEGVNGDGEERTV